MSAVCSADELQDGDILSVEKLRRLEDLMLVEGEYGADDTVRV
jgi:hypothetical protein